MTTLDQLEAKFNIKLDKLETTLNTKLDKLEVKLDAKLDKLEAKVDRLDTRLTGELTLLKWMLGLLLGGGWPSFSQPFFQPETAAVA